jgi:hypothetical protein
MTQQRDRLIRERAYSIWELEGSPSGRHQEHWDQAAREIEEAGSEETADTPTAEISPARARRKSAAKPASEETPAMPAEAPRKPQRASAAAPAATAEAAPPPAARRRRAQG